MGLHQLDKEQKLTHRRFLVQKIEKDNKKSVSSS